MLFPRFTGDNGRRKEIPLSPNLILLPKSLRSLRFAAVVFLVASFAGSFWLRAQTPNPEAAEHLTKPGPGPFGVPQVTFFVHRLGTDHAEGVTTLDMNGDGDRPTSQGCVLVRESWAQMAANGSDTSIARPGIRGRVRL